MSGAQSVTDPATAQNLREAAVCYTCLNRSSLVLGDEVSVCLGSLIIIIALGTGGAILGSDCGKIVREGGT